MQKKVVKVLFRKIGSRKDKRIIAFFPEIKVKHDYIMSFENGEYKETTYEFYLETKKAKYEEYEELLEELKKIYNDCKIEVKEKLHYSTLEMSWKRFERGMR